MVPQAEAEEGYQRALRTAAGRRDAGAAMMFTGGLCSGTRCSLVETLVQNTTPAPVEWDRQPALGFLLRLNVFRNTVHP